MAALCQDCTGCCKVFSVPEVQKAFGEPCKHLGATAHGPGCRIYEERPDACRHYVCLFLDGERRGDPYRLDPRMLPERSKVVIGWPWGVERETVHIYPYPGYPDAWKQDPVKDFIKRTLARGGKVVVYQDSKHLIAMKGDMAVLGTEEEFAEILA